MKAAVVSAVALAALAAAGAGRTRIRTSVRPAPSNDCARIRTSVRPAPSNVPRVIFDTDMYTDYDDVGALAILHALADAGECEIIAVGCNTWGGANRSVAACEVVNAYYGRHDLPVGCARSGGRQGEGGAGYGLPSRYPKWVKHLVSTNAPLATDVYRAALAASPDKSVVLCSVGFLNNVADLLRADRALVGRKVRLWVAMACNYPNGKEYNSQHDPAASDYAFSNWPKEIPIVWTDFQYGRTCYSGRAVAELPGEGNPVKDAFAKRLTPRAKVVPGKSWDQLAGHPSWDETASLIAVRGWEPYFNLERGRYRMVGTNGANEWVAEAASNCGRVTEKLSKAEVGRVMDELMCRPPADGFVPKNELDPWLKGLYGKLDYRSYALVDRSARTLEANTDGHRILTPENPWHPYRAAKPCDGAFDGVWNWDACFAAMGFARWSRFYAQEQFRALLLLQREDGFFGDVLRIDRKKWPYPAGTTRFPHTLATDWGKPPVAAWALWLVNRRQPDKAFLAEMYPRIAKSVAAWNAKRGGAKDGLFHYDSDGTNAAQRARAAGWESGMDNSPRWDKGAFNYHAVDLNAYMVLTYRALRDMAGELGLADDRARWAREATELAARIEARLWDEKTQCYQDWNFVEGRFSDVLTPASFLPLFAGIASKEHAAAMARQAARLEPMWPSVSYDHPQFDPQGYWRGRTWLNIAYFAIRGLKDCGFAEIAERGRRNILDMVAADPSTNYESYDPILRRARGCPRFSWSSTFVMDLVLDWDTPSAELVPQP